MRFIHTADWHLGNQMHGIDRKDEAQEFLRWLKEQIVSRNADTLIVAGDVFDTANPPVEARRLYYSFLASLVGTCCRNVVIVGGNHDSAVLLDAAKELLDVLNIHVVGSVANRVPAELCVELHGADGSVCGICLAVPFAREVELRALLADSLRTDGDDSAGAKVADGDLLAAAYTALYRQTYEAAEALRAGRNIPLIATGHLYAAALEGRRSGMDSSTKTDDGVKVLDVLGTLGNVPPSVFPPVDYVALGHIHYTTTVAGNPAVRYSGSPFVMGFDEAALPHHVLCCTITEQASGSPALAVEPLETPLPVVYRRLSGTLSEIRDALRQLAAVPVQKPTFLELCYKKEVGVSAQAYLGDAISALPPAVSVASWKLLEQEHAFCGGFDSFDSTEIRNLDDREIFTQLILSKENLEPGSDEAQAVLEKFLPLFMQVAEEL